MRKILVYVRFMCILLIVSLPFGTIMTSVGAQSSTTLYVDPPEIEYWSPAFGETFNVDVSIANVSNLQAFDFKLYWNTALLDLVEVEVHPFLPPMWILPISEINEALGRYWLNITSTNSESGSGPLATLTFEITYEPVWPENATCALNLDDTRLVNSTGGSISHDVEDGEYICYSFELLSITTMTDEPWYWLIGDTIHVYGNLTLGSLLVPDGIVALEIDNRLNEVIVIRSLSTGTPPANLTVEIIDVIPCGNQWGTPKNNFNRGDYAYFNVTVKNNDIQNRVVLIAVNVYDVNPTPIGRTQVEGFTVPAGYTTSVIPYVPIPETASVGDARVYASVLTDWPRDGGTAYCPEKWAAFQIEGGGGVGAPGGSFGGNYNLTFRLRLEETNGDYTIYTTSKYTTRGITQTATNTVTFEVKVPDLNDDEKVTITDIVIIAIAFGSAPVDDPETPWDETENWNPDADLNGDLKVSISDVVIAALHFGWGQ